MSVRKRAWVTRTGEAKEVWVVDYTDQHGRRHLKTFKRKKDADRYADQTSVDVRAGIHTPDATSITVAEAAADWLKTVTGNQRERATIATYREHVELHIVPRIGRIKLAKLTTPGVNAFKDLLLEQLSRALTQKVLISLKSILRDAQRRGTAVQNVATPVSIERDRRKQQLQVGVDIPTRDEISRLIAQVDAWLRPLLVTAVFTGMRASELRGLRWSDVNLKSSTPTVTVRQRADRYNSIGLPKTRAGQGRIIPLGPLAANTLKAWQLASRPGELVFAADGGGALYHNRLARALAALMLELGMVNAANKPRYAWHSLRHFYASWCINRKADGGLELPVKLVQTRLGHATIAMTLDTYGHLFPNNDDGKELAAAEIALLGKHAT
jgi:integrase